MIKIELFVLGHVYMELAEAVPVLFPTKSSENTAHAKRYSIPVVLRDIVLILESFSSVSVTKPKVLPTFVGYWNEEMRINVLTHTNTRVDPPEHGPVLVKLWLESCSDFKLSSEQLKKKKEAANSLLDSPDRITAILNLFRFMFMFWCRCVWLWCSWGTIKIEYWFNRSPYNCVQSQSGTSNRLNSNQFASIKDKNPILYMTICGNHQCLNTCCW